MCKNMKVGKENWSGLTLFSGTVLKVVNPIYKGNRNYHGKFI